MVAAQSIMPLFPPPHVNLTNANDAEYKKYVHQRKTDLRGRWENPEGQDLLQTLTGNAFDRRVLEERVGKIYGKFDLRGIPLSGRRLRDVDLSDCDLFAADLSSADLSRANLRGSYLSEANLEATCLDWARMEDVFVDKAAFDDRTSFKGVHLDSMNFTLAALLREAAWSQQVIHDLKERNPVLALILWATSNYGRSFRRFALWCLAIILVFAAAYSLAPQATNATTFWDQLYFSILTFTTVGFGATFPTSAVGQVLVVAEVLSGFFMMGLLIAILARKVLR